MTGSFWYHFEAWLIVGNGTYERVPARDFDALGPSVVETVGAVGLGRFGDTPAVIDVENAALYPGDGHLYALRTWPCLPLAGVSLN